MQKTIQNIFNESIKTKEDACKNNLKEIEQAARLIIRSLKKGGKLLICGNGGSAADSQHIAAEFIGRFQKERKSLAAIALTTDTSILTSLGNDYGYDIVFSRQIEGLAHKRDVVLGISTSGNSSNVVQAIKTAKKLNVQTITLTGHKGGKLARLSDIHLNVPSANTARIQESHICIAHILCELVEKKLS